MQQELKIREPTFWLDAAANGPVLRVAVLVINSFSLGKMTRMVDIQRDVFELAQFGNANEVVKLMETPSNYHLNIPEQFLELHWTVKGR